MFDLAGGVYRHRDLFDTPFSATEAAKAVAAESAADPKQAAARAIADRGAVRIIARRPVGDGYKLSGSAKGPDLRRVRPLVHVDGEGRIVEGSCTCPDYRKNRLTRGPCEHIIALHLTFMDRPIGLADDPWYSAWIKRIGESWRSLIPNIQRPGGGSGAT